MSKLLPVALLAALALVGCDAFSPSDTVPFSNVEEAEYLRVHVSGTTVIRDQSSWETFWRQHGGEAAAPPVDFERQSVLGMFYGGSFHAGCSSEVDVVRGIRQAGTQLVVELGPLPDLGPCRMVVHPLDVVVVDVPPAQARDVRFKGRLP